MTTKYIVDLECRYNDSPIDDNSWPQHKTKVMTLGIYDTYEEAAKAGNDMLVTYLESRFPRNENYASPERFGNTYAKYLVSDLSYLRTPFSFFARINRLDFGSIEAGLNEVVKAEDRYRTWKAEQNKA